MRKFRAVLAAAMLAMAVVPSMAMAAAKPTALETLVLKKKKLQTEREAATKKLVAAQTRRATPARRGCGSFLQCLFGNKRNAGVRNASLGSSAMSDYATGEEVAWDAGGKYAPGSIIVRTPERALYFVTGNGQAIRYSVGVGREGFQWSGTSKIIAKQEWPTWRPPQVMIEREAAKGHMLPDEMAGGPDNPLGARAMYIGGTMFRIHGTNNAGSIGGAVSSGCIRMMNTDVMDLYERVKVGARVYVYQ